MIPRISNLPLTVYNVHSENSKCFINISSYQRKVKSSLATKTLLMKQIHVSLQRWSPVERCHPSNIFPQGTVLDSDHEPTVHFRQRSLIFPASLKGYRIINLALELVRFTTRDSYPDNPDAEFFATNSKSDRYKLSIFSF